MGEAPGRLEDYKGKPFVGPAGQLLRKTLTKVGLDPNNAYYVNAVSCWPHGTPEQHHVVQCHDNLKAQLDAADSEYALVCGSTALKALLPHAKLTTAMKRFIKVHGKVIYPVYHPSYFLRNRDKTIRADWERALHYFSVVLHNDAWNVGESGQYTMCIYCGKKTWDGEIVCNSKQHKAWWKSDSTKWKRPVPPQLKLEL